VPICIYPKTRQNPAPTADRSAEIETRRARLKARSPALQGYHPGFAQFCPQIRPRHLDSVSGNLDGGDNLPRRYRNHTLGSKPCRSIRCFCTAEQILRLPQVCRVTGLGRSMIYQLEAERRFPTRCAWLACRGLGESEVQAGSLGASRSTAPRGSIAVLRKITSFIFRINDIWNGPLRTV